MGAGVGYLELCPTALWFRGGLNMMVVNGELADRLEGWLPVMLWAEVSQVCG